jgi:hypothetical protein
MNINIVRQYNSTVGIFADANLAQAVAKALSPDAELNPCTVDSFPFSDNDPRTSLILAPEMQIWWVELSNDGKAQHASKKDKTWENVAKAGTKTRDVKYKSPWQIYVWAPTMEQALKAAQGIWSG